MSLRDDCRALARPFRDDPRRRASAEIAAFKRCFHPVPDNNDARKYLSSILVLTWAVVTVGFASGAWAEPGVIYYGPLTALVWTLIGRMWGIEIESIGPVTVQHTDDDTASTGTDTDSTDSDSDPDP